MPKCCVVGADSFWIDLSDQTGLEEDGLEVMTLSPLAVPIGVASPRCSVSLDAGGEEDGWPKMKSALAEAKAATAIEEKLDGAAVNAEASVKERAMTPESADAASVSDEKCIFRDTDEREMQVRRGLAPRTPKTPEATTVAKTTL